MRSIIAHSRTRTPLAGPGLAALFLLLAGTSACSGDGADKPVADAQDTDAADTDTDTTTETDTDTDPVDTAFPPGDVGSLVVVQDGGRTALYAMFVNQQPGFENLASCAVTDTVCVPGFASRNPGTDVQDAFDPNIRFDPVFSQYRYVGDEITFGPWTAELRYDAERGIAFYFADLTGEDIPLGPMGVSWGVQWGDYAGTDDLFLQEPIEMIVPRATTVLTTNATTIPIEWIPQEDGGDIHLFATTGDPLFIGAQWVLEDDGYFEIPVDDVFSGSPPLDPTEIGFSLQRWNTDSTKFQGHVLDLVQISSAKFTASYDYVGSATEIELSDNCAQAVNNVDLNSTGTWSYWGRLAGYTSDLGDQCGIGSTDADGILSVELPPLSMLAATYTLPAADSNAALWVTDDCSQPDACVTGANVNDVTLPESVQAFNPSTTDTLDLYVVLGGDGTTDGIYTLDVTIDQLLEPDMADECFEATQQAGFGEGTYYSEDVAFLNTLDPGIACTNGQTPGPDGMMKVKVPPGTVMTAFIQMPGADPAIYVMTNCTQTQTCVAGADLSLNTAETLTWENTAIGEANVYIVVDTKGASLQPYFLTIAFTP